MKRETSSSSPDLPPADPTASSPVSAEGQAESAYSAQEIEDFAPYRAMSKMAVISLMFAVLSLPAILFPSMLFLPFLAAVCGIAGIVSVARNPSMMTGKGAATFGLLIGTLIFCGSGGYHGWVYLTEVPEGHERISFGQLKATTSADRVPETALSLDGKRVYVKGYVHPSVTGMGKIKHFVIVGDMGTCCFGGQPKLTEMIEVTLQTEEGIRYSQYKRGFGGVLRVSQQKRKVAGGLDGGYYELVVDHVR